VRKSGKDRKTEGRLRISESTRRKIVHSFRDYLNNFSVKGWGRLVNFETV